ncbi:MAG: ATP synthase F0 subunit A [Planctomycetota bacterium]|nr:MAG: ATP synthase F0 subunit A [Planctomycetota bacterium]
MFTIAADNPVAHVVDVPLVRTGQTGPLSTLISMHMLTMVFVAALVIATMVHVSRAMQRGQAADGPGRYVAKGRLAQMIEAVCVYLREEIVRPQLGGATDRFIGYLWALFFFILFSNLLGLVPILDVQHLLGIHWTPIGGTVTSNIAVTAALALIAFVIIQVNGIRSLGLVEYLKHYTAGAPAYLWPLMIPVEIMGTFIKPFALAVRLFANMVAGHTLIATLLMFTKMGLEGAGLVAGGGISAVAVLAALPLMMLEILVAFIQAFIFMILTTVFIAQLMHHEHHDEAHEHEDKWAGPPGEESPAVFG